MSYLLSIIIPTKNRYEYLKECINTLVSLKSDDLEIIIQDNSDNNDEIIEFMQHINRRNIKYYYSSAELSQTENSDLALSHTTGEYCCYIGDDDTVTEALIDITKYLKYKKIQACVCDMSTYHWADVVFEGKKKPSLSLNIEKGFLKKLSSKETLQNVLSYGVQDIKFLPRVYHGVIAKNVLDEIFERTGSYFPGPSPDMANAISASLLIDEYVYVRAPLIISGYSYKSASGLGLRGQHKGKLSNIKQLPKDAENKWSSRIPKIWLGYTVWPESAEKAFERMGYEKRIQEINYIAMEAKIYLRYKEYRNMIIRRLNSPNHVFLFIYECIRFMFRWSHERIILYTRIILGNQFIVNNHISLAEAFKITNKYNEVIMKGVL